MCKFTLLSVSASNYLRSSYDSAKACAIVESSPNTNTQLNSISDKQDNEDKTEEDKFHLRELARLPGKKKLGFLVFIVRCQIGYEYLHPYYCT